MVNTIKARRAKGETWRALADEFGTSAQGLRLSAEKYIGTIPVDPIKCAYCGGDFIPFRKECIHCGKPECAQEHRQLHWKKTKNRTPKDQREGKNKVQVKCIGRFCGGKTFWSPLVNDHGRMRPLYRLCGTCKSRNHEYCTGFGGY